MTRSIVCDVVIKCSRLSAVALTLAVLLASSASAQMSEQDREARCANNQARLAALEKQYASFASDEEIARLRTAANSISRYFADSPRTNDNPAPPGRRGQWDEEAWDRMKHWAREPCPTEFNAPSCLTLLKIELHRRIDLAVRQIPQRDAMAREIANIRGRMTELQCNVVQPSSGTDSLGAPDICENEVVGTWSWAFAPPGQTPAANGSVSFAPDHTMRWSGGSHGRWACSGDNVKLSWQDKPYADTMTRTGGTMTGTNNDGWNVRGTK